MALGSAKSSSRGNLMLWLNTVWIWNQDNQCLSKKCKETSGRQPLSINLPKNLIIIGYGIQTTQSWEGPARWSNQGPYLLIWNWRCRVKRGTPHNTGPPTPCRISGQYSWAGTASLANRQSGCTSIAEPPPSVERQDIATSSRGSSVLPLPHRGDQSDLQRASRPGGTLPREYKLCWDVNQSAEWHLCSSMMEHQHPLGHMWMFWKKCSFKRFTLGHIMYGNVLVWML